MPEQAHQEFSNIIESATRNIPLIIVGSGASACYGIPTMGMLAERIIQDVERTGSHSDVEQQWNDFKSHLIETNNLEVAILKLEGHSCRHLLAQVANITWQYISEKDTCVYTQAVNGDITLALTKILYRIGRGNSTIISILTTNYDRLVEYAIDCVNGLPHPKSSHYTGYTYGHIRRLDKEINRKRLTIGGRRAKETKVIDWHSPVEVWKVHGSIDWFQNADTQETFALERIPDIPSKLRPLIVTPGNEKYRTTTQEPYRTIIASADEALEKADSFLCLGFGFRDEHIQPKFIQRIKERKNLPIVILAKQLTDEVKDIFSDPSLTNYVLIEEADQSGSTRIVYKQNSSEQEVIIKGLELWNIDIFAEEFFPIDT